MERQQETLHDRQKRKIEQTNQDGFRRLFHFVGGSKRRQKTFFAAAFLVSFLLIWAVGRLIEFVFVSLFNLIQWTVETLF